MSDPSSTAPARPAGAPDPSTDLEAALKALVPTLAPVLRGQLPAVPVAAGLVTSLAGQQRYLGFSGNLLEASP